MDLVAEEGDFLYCADAYSDDLPYWMRLAGRAPLLMVPYAKDTNDMLFVQAHGPQTADAFFTYLRDDTFDICTRRGRRGRR